MKDKTVKDKIVRLFDDDGGCELILRRQKPCIFLAPHYYNFSHRILSGTHYKVLQGNKVIQSGSFVYIMKKGMNYCVVSLSEENKELVFSRCERVIGDEEQRYKLLDDV